MDFTIDDDGLTIMNDPDPVSDQAKNAFIQTREELLKHLNEPFDLAVLVAKTPMPTNEEDVIAITRSFEGFLINESLDPAIKQVLHVLGLGQTFTIAGQTATEQKIEWFMNRLQMRLEAVRSSRERAEQAEREAEQGAKRDALQRFQECMRLKSSGGNLKALSGS